MNVTNLPTAGVAPAHTFTRVESTPGVAQRGQTEVAPPPQGLPAPAEVETAVDQLSDTVALFTTDLQFTVHQETNRIIVRVTKSDTGEVIREIPPERFLDAVARVQAAIGLLLDERV